MKKHKLKNFLKLGIFLFGVSFFIFACQKDDETYLEESKTPKKNLNLTILRAKDVEKNTNLMRVINKAEKKVNDNKAGRIVYNSDYDFTLNTSYAKVIEANGLKNYTFGVYRTEDNGLLENLLLEEQADSTFIVSVVQYDLTESDINSLINKEIVDVEDKITFVALDDISDSIFNKDTACYAFAYVYAVGSSCGAGGNHSYSQGNACNAWGNPDLMATSGGWVLTASEVGCGGGSTSGSTPGSTSTSGNTSGTQSGGYGGGETYVPPTTTPVLCPECPELEGECVAPEGQLINQLNNVLGEGNYTIAPNCQTGSNDDNIEFENIEQVQQYLNNLQNSFVSLSGEIINNQNQSTIIFKGQFDNIQPLYINAHVTCVLDSEDTPNINEYNFISLNSFESGFTPGLDWEQDSYSLTEGVNGWVTIHINGHFNIGLNFPGFEINYDDFYVLVISFNTQTGERVGMTGIHQ